MMALQLANYHNLSRTYFTKLTKTNTGLTLFLIRTPSVLLLRHLIGL